MPRKTSGSPATDLHHRCFNEAAARCRGKRGQAGHHRGGRAASMRPRPDAAENTLGRQHPLLHPAGASMRPRPDAAENAGAKTTCGWRTGGFNEAAARCRGKRKQFGQLPAPLPRLQ